MDSESESEAKNFNVVPYRFSSSRDQSVNFSELARMQLKGYADIDEEDFQIIEEEPENINVQNIPTSHNYLRLHTTVVPIGYNFQVQIPDIIPAQVYQYRNQIFRQRLKHLKVHDPQKNSEFYDSNCNFIYHKFGANRTYEQICLLSKSHEEYPEKCSFQDYLLNKQVHAFWTEYFAAKDKVIASKLKKKKKKNKGSIPI